MADPSTSTAELDTLVEVITQAEDITAGFDIAVATFCHQTGDGIFKAMQPDCDTAEGRSRCAARMVSQWEHATTNAQGTRNTVFLKATVPDPDAQGGAGRRTVGFAIWVQLSVVEGWGTAPAEDLRKAMDLEALYPGDEREQRYVCQLMGSLHRQRRAIVRGKAGAAVPAIMALDLCCVDPGFQRRGVAQKLVQWGLDEAGRRGGMECTTEASSMGRGAYVKLGFRQDGPEIEYVVDDEFSARSRPSNIFMRTGNVD